MSRVVEASAPTRIDLAGGTLDIWPLTVIVPGAITVNVAVDLRATARVRPLAGDVARIRSRDRRAQARFRVPLRPEDAAGPLALLARLTAAFGVADGFELVTRAEAPAGAGLGGSSALGVAAGAALARFTGERVGRSALLRRVGNVEAVEIGVPTGNQDHLAALHGGLAAYHHGFDGTVREGIPVPRGLEERLVLAYTGEPRGSGFSNWEMFRRTVEGDPGARRRMRAIARISRGMRAALREGDLEAAGRLLGEEGRLRYGLAGSVATRRILAVDGAARRAGALGAKVCGAGGGGCVVALCREGRRDAVAEAMERAGARVLPVRIARKGLIVIES